MNLSMDVKNHMINERKTSPKNSKNHNTLNF